MELITQKIRQCIEKVKDMSQVGFDRDYVIKDNKPDAVSYTHLDVYKRQP